MLSKAYEWGNLWDSKFSIHNSNIVHHRLRSIKLTQSISNLGLINLIIVGSCKYLGIIIDEHLDYSECTNMLSQAGTRALGALTHKHKQVGLSYHTFTKLYNACVAPVILYSIAIWGMKEYTKINTVQIKAMKVFLSVNTFTSNACIYGDMGWTEINVTRKLDY